MIRPTSRPGGTAQPPDRGEHSYRHSPASPRNGSAPQVWGKRVAPLADVRGVRLSPTGMGEHIPMRFPEALASGSAPRVWGGLRAHRPAISDTGPNPSGVGHTAACPRRSTSAADQSHGRGDDQWAPEGGTVLDAGSTPRGWGARALQAVAQLRDHGPRRAGSTSWMSRCWSVRSAQPHTCGGACLVVDYCGRGVRLSPRHAGNPPWS
jgi:hypothetical protein